MHAAQESKTASSGDENEDKDTDEDDASMENDDDGHPPTSPTSNVTSKSEGSEDGDESESADTTRARAEVKTQQYQKHVAAKAATRAGKVRGVRDNKDTVIINSRSPHQERALRPQLVYV